MKYLLHLFVLLFFLYIQRASVKIIRDNSSDSDAKANALMLYFSSTANLTLVSGTKDILSAREVDELLDGLDDSIMKKSRKLFIMSQTIKSRPDTILGSSLKREVHSEIIKNSTKRNVINATVTAAALISDQSVDNINVLRMFILGDPTAYKTLDRSNRQTVVSSVIVISAQGKEKQLIINVTLYLKNLTNDNPHTDGQYSCAFFDTMTSRWNTSGCTVPQYNDVHSRFECTCNHLTSFALIWSPRSVSGYLNSQDIVSLILQSISIICFIAVIIHSLTLRLLNPTTPLRPRDFLPLISSASTTLLFIFYIALGMTVYTRIPITSSTTTPCFTSASVLMFFVYFFLIFMFCVKTSVGYFNYIRFVCLFPEPSHKKLSIMLILSFFISITWTLIAIGFNTNSSYHITQIHGNKLCWFAGDAIYYFMTIPAGIFLLLNFITIILVGKHIIDHVRRSTSPHQSYERIKRCVLVLLSSCVTQGIGWLFGPFISIVSPTSEAVLGWFFIILIGLEGVWTILLYIIIRLQLKDESKPITNSKQRTKNTSRASIKSKEKRKINGVNNVLARRHQSSRKEQLAFNDLYNEESIDWETSSCEA